MTAANPFDGQPPASQNPISADGFISIMGATWLKPATGREERRDESLIKTNQS
jgi:hypothetical protein